MISKYTRELILSKREDLTYLSVIRSNLTDGDLLELALLVKQNPYIKVIDLDCNPFLTETGVKNLMRELPGVAIVNADCVKSIDQLMEESTNTFKPLTLPLRFASNFTSHDKTATQSLSKKLVLDDTTQQNSSITTNIL